MKEKKCITIFSQKLAAKLMLSGHKLVGMEKDKLNQDRNVFFFLNTKEVNEAVMKLK